MPEKSIDSIIEQGRMALSMLEDLPDGMDEDVTEAFSIYRDEIKRGAARAKAREDLAEALVQIFEDWGFPV